MTPTEASAVLGVSPNAVWDDVRRAYRTMMRTHHPDRAGPTHAEAAALITQAFAVLEARHDAKVVTARSSPTAPRRSATRPASTSAARGQRPTNRASRPSGSSPSATPPGSRSGGPVRLLANDTIGIDDGAENAFRLLLEAANDAGEVTYIDPDIGLIETIISFPGAPVSSLVLTLQARADHVEAFCTVEALGGGPPPPLAAVVEVLADLARRRVGQPAPHPVRAPREWLTESG